MKYAVLIIGAGHGGIFAAYELLQLDPAIKVGDSRPCAEQAQLPD